MILSFALLLNACSIASPLTTTENFLNLLQAQEYDRAADLLVIQDEKTQQLRFLTPKEKKAFIKSTQEKLGKVYRYDVQNNVPLNEASLVQFDTNQGYEVFYSLSTEKEGEKEFEHLVLKLDSDWKILTPNF